MKPNLRLGLLILAIDLPVNVVCEYLHMPLFEVSFLHGYADSRLVLSILSALLNLIWTYLICAVMGMVFRRDWIARWTLLKVTGVVVGTAVLVSVGERIALATGLWSYTAAMPIIPVVGIGLTPFLIISTVPLATLYLASRFVQRSQPHL